MLKTYTLILASALIAFSCTTTRPTAQARVAVSLPWGAQQLTDSLKYLLAHVVRMDTAQYQVTETNGVRLFNMRPGATVHDLTVVGKLNVLAAPGDGLPDTIHLPHDSIPHLPGDGLEMKSQAARWPGTLGPGWTNFFQPSPPFAINPYDLRALGGSVDTGTIWHAGPGITTTLLGDSVYITAYKIDKNTIHFDSVLIEDMEGLSPLQNFSDTSKWEVEKVELRHDIPNFVAASPVIKFRRVHPPTKKKKHARH